MAVIAAISPNVRTLRIVCLLAPGLEQSACRSLCPNIKDFRAFGRCAHAHCAGVVHGAMTFAEMGLSKKGLSALEHAGFEAPTPIQAQAIPHALQGKDVIGAAATGTGK